MRVFGVFLSLNGLLFILCEREKFYYFLFPHPLRNRSKFDMIGLPIFRFGGESMNIAVITGASAGIGRKGPKFRGGPTEPQMRWNFVLHSLRRLLFAIGYLKKTDTSRL